MADIKISDLTAAGTLTGTEEVPIVQSSSTVKATAQDIADLAAGGTNIGTSNLTITDATRKLIMQGSTSGETFSIRDTGDTANLWSIDGGGVVTFNEAFSFPTTDGTANQVLQTDGAGAVTWATAGGGSNIATSDLTISATGTRKLTMSGSASTDIFAIYNAAGTDAIFKIDGTGRASSKGQKTGAFSELNTMFGELTGNTTGTFNSYFGYEAAGGCTSADSNAVFGYRAFQTGNGSSNVVIGALAGNTGGFNNSVVIGANAGKVLGSSSTNVIIGYEAYRAAPTGANQNVVLGGYSGYDVNWATADNNTFLGYNTGRGITTGNGNTIIGGNSTGITLSNPSHNIIISDGVGGQGFKKDREGNVILGPETALATTDTNGFNYVRGGAGTPTGTPSTTVTGHVPMYADTTNNKLYIYSGGSWVALN